MSESESVIRNLVCCEIQMRAQYNGEKVPMAVGFHDYINSSRIRVLSVCQRWSCAFLVEEVGSSFKCVS